MQVFQGQHPEAFHYTEKHLFSSESAVCFVSFFPLWISELWAAETQFELLHLGKCVECVNAQYWGSWYSKTEDDSDLGTESLAIQKAFFGFSLQRGPHHPLVPPRGQLVIFKSHLMVQVRKENKGKEKRGRGCRKMLWRLSFIVCNKCKWHLYSRYFPTRK